MLVAPGARDIVALVVEFEELVVVVDDVVLEAAGSELFELTVDNGTMVEEMTRVGTGVGRGDELTFLAVWVAMPGGGGMKFVHSGE